MFRGFEERIIGAATGGWNRRLFLSNFFPEHTGLDFTIWLDSGQSLRHKLPVCWVEVNDRLYPVSVNEPVKFLMIQPKAAYAEQFRKIQQFVRLNRDVMLEHWRGRIDTAGLVERMVKSKG